LYCWFIESLNVKTTFYKVFVDNSIFSIKLRYFSVLQTSLKSERDSFNHAILSAI